LSESESDKKHRCKPGTFSTPQQWRAQFNTEIRLKRKALVAVPIGIGGRPHLRSIVSNLGYESFDFLFFAYDSTDWSQEPWHPSQDADSNVEIISSVGFKWTLYQEYLNATRVSKYSHLFLWDEDMAPAPGFDGELLLQILQAFDIGIAQPVIRKKGGIWFGTQAGQLPGLMHEVPLVEVMCPCYATEVYLNCILPRLKLNRGYGFGVDYYVQNFGECVPDVQYTIEIPLDHMDAKSLGYAPANNTEFLLYKADKEEDNWPARTGFSPPWRSHDVALDKHCVLTSNAVESYWTLPIPGFLEKLGEHSARAWLEK